MEYNSYVRVVNRNYEWISCKGFFFDYPKYMEIPLDWKVPYNVYLEDLAKIQAIYWGQIKTIAIVGGCFGGLLFLAIVLL